MNAPGGRLEMLAHFRRANKRGRQSKQVAAMFAAAFVVVSANATDEKELWLRQSRNNDESPGGQLLRPNKIVLAALRLGERVVESVSRLLSSLPVESCRVHPGRLC